MIAFYGTYKTWVLDIKQQKRNICSNNIVDKQGNKSNLSKITLVGQRKTQKFVHFILLDVVNQKQL